MDYSGITTKSKSIIKRISHQKRHLLVSRLLDIKNEDVILDFGTGDGYLLNLIRQENAKVKLFGYEPIRSQYEQAIHKLRDKDIIVYQDIEKIKQSRFTKIVCAEVLEHLTLEKQIEILSLLKELLTNGGNILITVPIEIRSTAIIKNLIRLLSSSLHEGSTLSNVARSTLSLKVTRSAPQKDYINSHIGFDYREIITLIQKQGLKLTRTYYSPIPILRGILNSQVLFLVNISRSS